MSKNTKLIEAYNNLMEHLYEVMDDSLHSMADALFMILKENLNARVLTYRHLYCEIYCSQGR